MTSKNVSRHTIDVKTFRDRRKSDVPTLLNAVDFFLDELLKRCTIAYKLNIKVTLKNGPVRGDDKSLNDGLAWEHESGTGVKWFHIHLNDNVPFLELLSTLAHETVHVVQFATGRLRIEDEDWIWEGKNYGPKPYIGEEVDNQLPWEYDAYSKEPELARKFVILGYSIW